MGSLIAEVASEKMGQAKGKAFSIRRNDLPCNEKEFDRLFGRVSASQVQESEALKDFERSFGYVFASFGTGSTAFSPWMSTEFRPVWVACGTKCVLEVPVWWCFMVTLWKLTWLWKVSIFNALCQERGLRNFTRSSAANYSRPADYSRLQPTTADYSRLRPTTADYGRLQPTTADYSRLQPTTADYSRLQLTSRLQPITANYSRPAEYSWVQLSTVDYNRLQPSAAEHNRAQPSTAEPPSTAERPMTAEHRGLAGADSKQSRLAVTKLNNFWQWEPSDSK